MHSLKTPSRSTMRSWVRSRPSKCTFQYIQRDGAIVGLAGSFGPLRISPASFSLSKPASSSSLIFSSTNADRADNCEESHSRIFLRINIALVQMYDSTLFEHSVHQRFDLRVNQRLTAADGNHGRVAFRGRSQAILEVHDVLERRGIFANPSATGTGEIAGMQRLQLKHRGKLFRAAHFLRDHVRCDLGRQREGKSHKVEDSNEGRPSDNRPEPPKDRPNSPTKASKSCAAALSGRMLPLGLRSTRAHETRGARSNSSGFGRIAEARALRLQSDANAR